MVKNRFDDRGPRGQRGARHNLFDFFVILQNFAVAVVKLQQYMPTQSFHLDLTSFAFFGLAAPGQFD
jgi:hypothetical protein